MKAVGSRQEADGRRQTAGVDAGTARLRSRHLGNSTRVFSCLLPSAVCLLIVHCSLLTANAQPGMPQPSSPLYGQRPSNGPVSTGLPKALQDVGIDQKLGQQLPLDLVFKDENGKT